MHEFSLAQHIFEIIEETKQTHHLHAIEQVVLEIGQLAGVEIPALYMAIQSGCLDTPLAKCHFVLSVVPAESCCLLCHTIFSPEELYSPCPHCGSFSTEITQGKQLKVKSITGE